MPGPKGASWGPVAVLGPDELAHLGDENLLRRYQVSRAPAAFELIVARHRQMVFRTCFRRLHNVHDAEDATQATFLALAQRPGIVRTSLVGYLHGLALSAAKQIQRTESRVRRSQSEVARIGEIVRRLGRSMHSTTRSDLREEIDAALARLPGPLRQAVILCHLEGRTQREAADLAGCTPVTMGWRTMKGIARLRSILDRQGVMVSTAVLLAFLGAEARSLAAGSAIVGAVAGGVGGSRRAAEIAASLLKSLSTSGLPRLLLVPVSALALTVGLGAVYAVGQSGPAADAELPSPPRSDIRLAPRVVPANRFGAFLASADIGDPAKPGSVDFAAGTYVMRGGGATIYGRSDQFHFTYREWRGDGEIVARVRRVGTAPEALAGVMFRASIRSDSQQVAMLVNPHDKHICKARTPSHRESVCTTASHIPGPAWVRVVRRGDKFTASFREEGSRSWTWVADWKLEAGPVAYLGLAVTAHDNKQIAEAVFDHVTIQPPTEH